MPIAYQLLPWVRRGLSVALDAEENFGALPVRGSAHIGVTLTGQPNGETINPIALRLHGPGDVIGIDQRLIVRTDPRPQVRDFEPNYLALIEFDPPEFPWLLTPAQAKGDRLRPWLVLIVVEQNKTGLPRMSSGAQLPSIKIKGQDVATELPDLKESWSWAHAQLVNDNAAQIANDLKNAPNSNISRLVCPRRLKEDTDYVACVVPAFEPGRLRGLGLNDQASAMTTLAPAWNKAEAADVELPVYYHWAFSTGPVGDFESMARRLRTPTSYKGTPIEQALKDIGTVPMSVDDLLNGNKPGLVTTMEGAFVPIDYTPGLPPPDGNQMQALETIVNTPQDQVANPVDDADNKRLEVKPPLYGAWHAKKHQVFRQGSGPAGAPKFGAHWLAGLNLDPRYRGAAGYGAEVVRKNQEDYVDACWAQVGDIRQTEMKFNLTRLAIEALTALKRKHFDGLPPERILQVFGPALPRIEAYGSAAQTYRINNKIASLGGQLARSSMPTAMADTALRRMLSPANRSLRLAARLNASTKALPQVIRSYIGTMAKANTRPAAFNVNAFMPDGILGTRLFDQVKAGAGAQTLDLSALGLPGAVFTGDDLAQLRSSTLRAQEALSKFGVPELKIRDGQHLGIFTDLHVERFGVLASTSPVIHAKDWGNVASQVEILGKRGIEGFLIEATASANLLQFNPLTLDSRNGQLALGTPVTQAINASLAPRQTMVNTVAINKLAAALAPIPKAGVGSIELSAARTFNVAGLFAALPPNAISSSGTELKPAFTLTGSLEFASSWRVGAQADYVSITMPPALRERAVLDRFAAAIRGVQACWADAYTAKRVAVQTIDFTLDTMAAIVKERTKPSLTLPRRLASTVSIAQLGIEKNNAHAAAYLPAQATLAHRYMVPELMDRVMAWPHLRNAFYRDLADYDKTAFLPGVDNLPQDLIMLVQVNQRFIDAVMAGANFEMNRELLWRGFPTDLRGTPFQRFWGRVRLKATGVLELLDDMEPMHQWRPQPLGERQDANMPDPNRVALLVRGRLLRRYPNTAVYAWKKDPNKPQLLKINGAAPADAIQVPVFGGFIEPDITFFGFDIDKEEIDKWCFVLEEHMTEPRFGFDVDIVPEGQPQGAAQAQRTGLKWALEQLQIQAQAQAQAQPGISFEPSLLPATYYNPYQALSWTHLGVAAGDFAAVSQLTAIPNKPFASFPTLGANASAAEIAKVLLQQPFRAYYLGADLKT